jgi:hypothetical protein
MTDDKGGTMIGSVKEVKSLNVQIETSPFVIRAFDIHDEGKDGVLFEITDDRGKWRTWTAETWLRLPTNVARTAQERRETPS